MSRDKDDAYKNLDRVGYWLGNVDGKASYAIALASVLVGLFITDGTAAKVERCLFAPAGQPFSSQTVGALLTVVSSLAFVCCSVGSIVHLLKALRASVSIEEFRKDSRGTNSVIFFGSIANMRYEEYVEATRDMSEEDLIADIDHQTYINSQICKRKFDHYSKGLRFLVVSFPLLVIFRLLSIPR